MSTSALPAPRERWKQRLSGAALAVAAVVCGLVFAKLTAMGLWYVGLILLALIPAFVWFHRYPIAAIGVWLAVMPMVTATASPALRQVFWIVHRFLPVGVLVILLVGVAPGTGRRRLSRLSWPDIAIGAFLLVGLVSIGVASPDPAAQVVLFYDRWIAPACLYLLVRLLGPSIRGLRWLPPLALGILAVEAPITIATLTIPQVLPAEWVILTRGTGSFGDPDVLGVVMALCGVVLLWAGTITPRRGLRAGSIVAFLVAMLMMFLTFSRANWLACIVVFGGCLWLFRRRLATLLIAVPIVLVALLVSGALAGPLSFAQERLDSAEARRSALERLPVAVAALRMLEARPLAGFGYGNFDTYSRDYQGSVGNVVTADKNHASHNLFLTIMAELGLVGIVTFLAPMVMWGRRSLHAARRMPSEIRTLVGCLWLVVAAIVLDNNFSVMTSPYGLGIWWLTLGLIGTLVARYLPRTPSRLGGDLDAVGAPGPLERRGGEKAQRDEVDA